jgi:hypothetical protein
MLGGLSDVAVKRSGPLEGLRQIAEMPFGPGRDCAGQRRPLISPSERTKHSLQGPELDEARFGAGCGRRHHRCRDGCARTREPAMREQPHLARRVGHARLYRSNDARTQALASWLATFNRRRPTPSSGRLRRSRGSQQRPWERQQRPGQSYGRSLLEQARPAELRRGRIERASQALRDVGQPSRREPRVTRIVTTGLEGEPQLGV